MSQIFGIPEFNKGIRVMLVEQVSRESGKPTGRFGVAMAGGRFTVQLPEGYDGRTSVRWVNGFVFAAHPELPPLMCDTNTDTVQIVEPATLDRVIADVRREYKLAADTRIIH